MNYNETCLKRDSGFDYVKGLVNLQKLFKTPIDWKARNEKQNVESLVKNVKIINKLWSFQTLIRWKYARDTYDVIWAFWNINFNIFHLF